MYKRQIDANDFTYFNGVEVGHTEGCMAFRSYTVPASLVKAGKATIAVRVMDTGGKGGIYGDPNSMALRRSDKEFIPLAGAWKYKLGLGLGEAPELPVNTATEPNYPTSVSYTHLQGRKLGHERMAAPLPRRGCLLYTSHSLR